MVDQVFNLCVDLLLWLGDLTGLGYNGINVLIFCVIWPVFTLLLMYVVYVQRKEITNIHKAMCDMAKEAG
jgi:hypothetical protein